MANDPDTLMVTVAQGNRGPAHRVIQSPSQYRALTPRTPPADSMPTLMKDSTPPPFANAGPVRIFMRAVGSRRSVSSGIAWISDLLTPGWHVPESSTGVGFET